MKASQQSTVVLLWMVLGVASTAAAQGAGHEPAGPGAGLSALLTPPRDGGPVVVRVAFHLQNINDIDDEAETFEFTGVLTTTWQDKRQAFDPRQAQVDEKFYQGEFQFDEISPGWYPQVVLANESGMYEKHAVLLRVKPDGTSTLIETVNAVARVNLNLRRYPLDRQQLEAVFEVLGFDTSEVVLETAPMPVHPRDSELQIPEWTLTRLDTSVREHFSPYAGESGRASAFVLTLDVRRQSFFMLRLVVVPLALIVFLTWSVFWMDRAAMGDRLSISFIGILTAVAYQMVVGGIMPQISHVTLMNAFLNFIFFVMCATVVINLIVGISENSGKTARAESIDRRCRWIFPLTYIGLVSASIAIAFILF